MLLRICLVIAILAGAGVIALSHLKVRPHVQEIIDAREKNAKDRDTEKGLKTKALAELKATKKDLEETKATLSETQTQLASTKSQAEAEHKHNVSLTADLVKVRADFTESQQKLARWDAVRMDPSQVQDLIASEKNLKLANQALDEEKKFFAEKYKKTQAELDSIRNPDEDPIMRAGLRGKVLIVDPKWNFVVLDVGEKAGAVKNGVLMVSRNTKLVAKVRIMTLENDRCIANIMPGWSLGEVMEGDQVLY